MTIFQALTILSLHMCRFWLYMITFYWKLFLTAAFRLQPLKKAIYIYILDCRIQVQRWGKFSPFAAILYKNPVPHKPKHRYIWHKPVQTSWKKCHIRQMCEINKCTVLAAFLQAAIQKHLLVTDAGVKTSFQ